MRDWTNKPNTRYNWTTLPGGLPHVTWEDGDLRLEWWNGDKKLTIYLGTEGTWWTIVDGTEDEFEDGTLEPGGLQSLMEWLVS